MARLNDDGQWIILMAFIICIAIFFLALIVNQSTLVGKTTAEAVLDFPKSDVQDFRNEILRIREIIAGMDTSDANSYINNTRQDMQLIAIERKSALVYYSINTSDTTLVTTLRFNNGVTEYNETYY
ncbi:MAG: hypothetical protein WC382_12410 [Methanoregulaceae archaeon]|jgi:hypothetical protein